MALSGNSLKFAMTSTIRRALPDEADTLTRIALDAKRYWGYPEHWIKHWESDLTVSSDFIRDNHVYVTEHEGEIRGFYALSVSGNKAELEHMWVTPTAIGTGVGKELFLDAMDRAATLEVREIEHDDLHGRINKIAQHIVQERDGSAVEPSVQMYRSREGSVLSHAYVQRHHPLLNPRGLINDEG